MNGPMYERIWLCRKISLAISLGVLLYIYYTYEDYNAINNKLLKEIQQQNLELQTFLQNMKLGEFTSTPINTLKNEFFPSVLSKQNSQKKISLNEEQSFYEEINKSEDNTREIILVKKASKVKLQNLNKTKMNIDKTKVSNNINSVTKASKPKSKSDNRDTTPKKEVLQSLKENLSYDVSPLNTSKYNLRKRTSTPTQSPYSYAL